MDTIQGMRTFLAVVDTGSFRAGAERLDMSTALASKYIGQLEKRVGHRLLNRTTRSLSLTEIGEIYLARCRPLVEDFDQLKDALQDQHHQPAGRLIVSAPVSFGELHVASAVSRFVERYPDIAIDLRLTDRLVNLVDEGIDVAIRIAKLGDSSLIARKLANVGIVACAAPEYLQKRGTPDHPKALSQHDCVLDRNFQNGDLWPFQDNGRSLTVKATGRIKVNGAMAARAFVLGGNGVGLIPSYAVADDLRDGRLVQILEAFNAFDLGVHAVYPQGRFLAPKVRVFVDFLVGDFGRGLV